MKQNIRVWFSLLFFGLLVIGLVDKAHAGFPALPEGSVVFWAKTGSLIYFSHQGYKDPQDGLRPQAEEKIPACQLAYPDMECLVQGYNEDPIQGAAYTWGGGGYEMHVTGRVRVVAIPPGVTCDPPNYINENDECVEPDEICLTDLESMAEECTLIGPDLPDDDLPNGCAVNSLGIRVCITDDPNCYEINGDRKCAIENAVCGMKNGTYNCVLPEQEGCGYFNGERVCFTQDGEKVDKDSPDHPDNGGNLDGDETNDPKDPRPPEEGGDENNQPGSPDGLASEKTSQNILHELRGIGATLKDIKNAPGVQSPGGSGGGGSGGDGGDGETPTEVDFSPIIDEKSTTEALNAAKTDMNKAVDDAIAELDGVAEGMGDAGPMGTGDLNGVSSGILGIFSSGQCQDIKFGKDALSLTLSCEHIQKIRDALAFILYVFTAWRLFSVVTRPAASARV